MSDSRCRVGATIGVRGGGHRPRGRAGLKAAIAGLAMLAVTKGAGAQEPAAQPQPAPAAGSALPLSLRYHFVERYGLAENPARPDVLVEYQVGSVETIRRERETAQGAPDRQETTTRTIYTERPARLGKLGEVLDTVRRYDLFRGEGVAAPDPRTPPPLVGLSLWYHPRTGYPPEVISLTPDRRIRQAEFLAMRNQVFFPRLAGILPVRPVRVDDSWGISRQAASVFLAEIPEAGNYQLDATLLKVEKASQGTAMTATIDISGTMDFPSSEGSVRARFAFVFEPLPDAGAGVPKEPAAPPARGAPPRDPAVVEAHGHIARLSMSLQKVLPLDKEGRFQEVWTGQLQMQRRRSAETLPVVATPPAATESNSWIVYEDPQGRYRLSHPQELVLLNALPDGVLQLVARRANGSADFLRIEPILRQAGVALDRGRSDPQAFVKELKATFAREGHQLLDGPIGWLPEKVGAPDNRKVYRLETAIKPDPEAAAVRGAARFYLDAYLVIFGRGDCFHVYATTDRDDHVAYRDQAEALIRTIELGPAVTTTEGAAGRAAPARPAAAPPTPDRPAAPAVPRLDRSH